jgi:cell division protein FtsB
MKSIRLLTLALAGVVVLLQNPLWFGRGGWLRVNELEAQVAAQRKVNDGLRTRNDALLAEVRDLKQGYDAIEERARAELGMIRGDEVFFQVLETAPRITAATGATTAKGAPPASGPPVTEAVPAAAAR